MEQRWWVLMERGWWVWMEQRWVIVQLKVVVWILFEGC
jgi:hypothetical protein